MQKLAAKFWLTKQHRHCIYSIAIGTTAVAIYVAIDFTVTEFCYATADVKLKFITLAII